MDDPLGRRGAGGLGRLREGELLAQHRDRAGQGRIVDARAALEPRDQMIVIVDAAAPPRGRQVQAGPVELARARPRTSRRAAGVRSIGGEMVTVAPVEHARPTCAGTCGVRPAVPRDVRRWGGDARGRERRDQARFPRDVGLGLAFVEPHEVATAIGREPEVRVDRPRGDRLVVAHRAELERRREGNQFGLAQRREQAHSQRLTRGPRDSVARWIRRSERGSSSGTSRSPGRPPHLIFPRVRDHIELDELIGLANAGLAEAAQRYDPARGASFATFAWYRVQGSIVDGLRKSSHLPRRTWAKLVALRAASDYLEQRGERDAGAAQQGARPVEGAEALAQVRSSLSAIRTMYLTSLEALQDSGFDREDELAATPDVQLDTNRAAAKLRLALEALPEKEQALMKKHYWEGKNLLEAGAELGISKSWASRLHAQAVERLRAIVDAEA